MVSCAIEHCKNTSGNASKFKDGISFHRFPKDGVRRRQWEIAVNRGDWKSTNSSTICSEHFSSQDFYLTDSGLRRLSLEAVPSPSTFPNVSSSYPVAKLELVSPDPNEEEVLKLKFKVKRLEVIAYNRKRRLDLMWQSRRRLKRKLDKMKIIIKHLITMKRRMISENKENDRSL